MTDPWQEFIEVVQRNLISKTPILDLGPEMSLADLELDSLGIMSIITDLEQTFNVLMPANALDKGLDTTLGELRERSCAAI